MESGVFREFAHLASAVQEAAGAALAQHARDAGGGGHINPDLRPTAVSEYNNAYDRTPVSAHRKGIPKSRTASHASTLALLAFNLLLSLIVSTARSWKRMSRCRWMSPTRTSC